MQSYYRFPDPGPETEAQKERAHFMDLMTARARNRRRNRWSAPVGALKRVFQK